jgi:hypothetical protein
MIHTRSICAYTAVVLSLWGCSGGDGNPAPYAQDGIVSPVQHQVDADAGAVAVVSSTPPSNECDEEGATSACMAPIGIRAGFVLCAQGERTCARGHWTSCESQATSGPVSGWEPAIVGCNPPPEPCPRDSETRACVKQLPPTPESVNCYHGTQTCSGNVWGVCVP